MKQKVDDKEMILNTSYVSTPARGHAVTERA